MIKLVRGQETGRLRRNIYRESDRDREERESDREEIDG